MPYRMITDSASLHALSRDIKHERELALDLEMDSLHSYREKVCLIQISTKTGNWIIDPLAIHDLSPLSNILADDSKTIVLHGADYDVRSMRRDFGLEVGCIFDTMLAARFIGITDFGLSALLTAKFGISLDKKFQKADWNKRPLSQAMCEYAVADTAHLLELSDWLRNELNGLGRLSWLEEECSLIREARIIPREGPLFLQCKGAGKLKGRSLALLESLLAYREKHAERLNRPPFKVLASELLLEIAVKMPNNPDVLSCIKGMTPKLIERYSHDILNMIKESIVLPASSLPCYPRKMKPAVTEHAQSLLKKLKVWRGCKSANLGLDPGVLAPNRLLENISNTCPTTLEELSHTNTLRKWQLHLYGSEVLELVQSA